MTRDADLVTEHIPQLRSYARALVRRVDNADDLVQDCLQRALEKLHLFERGSNLRAWLFTIMHNIHVSNMRRCGGPVQFIHGDEADRALAQGGHKVNTQASADDMRDLESALATLSEEQREVIHLVGVEELAYGEAARILDIPIGTVMSRLHRAREQLRTAMYGEYPSGVRSVK